MRNVAWAALLAGCGYSSYWPDHPHEGGLDTADEPIVDDLYHEPGTPPCSTNLPLASSQLEVVNGAARELRVYTVAVATCAEESFLHLNPGGAWTGTVDPNLVFVVRGLDGGLVRWFVVPEGSDWIEVLP